MSAIEEQVKKGTALKRLWDSNFETMVKYHRGIKEASKMLAPEWEEKPREFIVLWGEAGAGKSWKAMEIIGEDSYYIPDENNSGLLSFESYDGQKWILLEDFDAKSLGVTPFKRMTDRYACMLGGRGSSVQGRHCGVIVTSNYDPTTWYPNQEDYRALLRRMTVNNYCARLAWKNILDGTEFPNPCPHVRALQIANFNPNFLL